jgi:hypothetical protein
LLAVVLQAETSVIAAETVVMAAKYEQSGVSWRAKSANGSDDEIPEAPGKCR